MVKTSSAFFSSCPSHRRGAGVFRGARAVSPEKQWCGDPPDTWRSSSWTPSPYPRAEPAAQQASDGAGGQERLQEAVHPPSGDKGLQPSQREADLCRSPEQQESTGFHPGRTGDNSRSESLHTPPSETGRHASIFKSPHNVGDQDLFTLQGPANGSSCSLGFKPPEWRLALL